jgi:hypothetical protein
VEQSRKSSFLPLESYACELSDGAQRSLRGV